MFELGSLSGGTKQDSDSRIRMTERMAVRAGSTLRVAADFVDAYNWGIQTFDAQGNYISKDYGWMNETSFVIPEDVAFIQINCKKIDGRAMSADDISKAESSFSVGDEAR